MLDTSFSMCYSFHAIKKKKNVTMFTQLHVNSTFTPLEWEKVKHILFFIFGGTVRLIDEVTLRVQPFYSISKLKCN